MLDIFRRPRSLRALALVAVPALLPACSLISPDTSAATLKANADKTTSIRIPLSPAHACAKTARMLMWCAAGPNFHYRCNSTPGGERSELTGELEAVFRTEFFMVTEFARTPNGSIATVRQYDSYLVRDYASLIETYFTNPECEPD